MDVIDTFFNWGVLRSALPMLMQGLGITVMLGAVCHDQGRRGSQHHGVAIWAALPVQQRF